MKSRNLLLILITPLLFFVSDLYSQRDLIISGGNDVSSVLCANSTIYVWGNNTMGTETGLLGTGGEEEFYDTPQLVTFPGGEEVLQVNSGSGSHFVVLDCDNQVWSWGYNGVGQVGNGEALGDDGFVDAPTRVLASDEIDDYYKSPEGYLINAEVIYAGNMNSFAILDNGRLVSWGGNSEGFVDPYDYAYGQLGDGTQVDRYEAVYVRTDDGDPIENVTYINAGDNVAYALVDESGDGVGTVYSWGYGLNGTLGRNADGTDNPNDGETIIDEWARPVHYGDGSVMDNIVDITAGDVFGGALDTDGYVWTWGNNWNGATGTGNHGSTPMRVLAHDTEGESNDGQYLLASSIGGGQGFGMAVTVDNKPVAWGGGGCGDGGATGNGTTTGSPDGAEYIMHDVDEVHDDVILINRGDLFGFYGRADGSMWAWGCNDNGELGLGDTNDRAYADELILPTACEYPAIRPFVNLRPASMTVCESEFLTEGGVTLNSGFMIDVEQEYYDIRWYKDNVLVENGTAEDVSPDFLSYDATEIGTYSVEVEYTGYGTGCQDYEIATQEMTIDAWDQTFTIPTLTYCDTLASLNVNATEETAMYSWYPTETSNTPLATTTGSESIIADISDAEDGDGTDKIVYVEETYSSSGTVFEKDEACNPDWDDTELHLGNGDITDQNQSGFTIFEPVNLEQLSARIRVETWDPPFAELEITFGIYGSTINNQSLVADESNQIGSFTGYVYTEEEGDEDYVFDDIDVFLPEEGTYFISVDHVNHIAGNFNARMLSGNCTQDVPVVDNVTGEIIHYTHSSQDFSNPLTGDQLTQGKFFDVEFSTGQHFCDRIAVTLTEDCTCNTPDPFIIESTEGEWLCAGESTVLSASVNQPNTTDFDFTWYRGDHETGTIVKGPAENVNNLELTVDHAGADTYTLLVRDKNTTYMEDCWQYASFTINVYDPMDAGEIAEDQSICYDDTPEPFTSVTNPSGGDGSWTYQWQSSTDGSSWVDITGATGVTYEETSTLSETTYYRRTATNDCGTVESNEVAASVSYTIPPLAHCNYEATVYVNAVDETTEYSWYLTETSTEAEGTTTGSESITINVLDAEDAGGTDRIVYVEYGAVDSDDDCEPVSLNFSYTGDGEFCWIVSGDIDFINSNSSDLVEVNGVDITNVYVAGGDLPPRENGNYYIVFEGPETWSYIEIEGEDTGTKESVQSESDGVRCPILLVEDCELPIELISFEAIANGQLVNLEWKTATEVNNDYFKIERSKDGNNFETIATIEGSGTTSMPKEYEVTDTEPYQGLSYYKLTQVDFDGQSESFPLEYVYISNGEDQLYLEILYNYDNNYNIHIGGINDYSISLQIFDAMGNKIFANKYYTADKDHIVLDENDIGVLLKQGLYVVVLSSRGDVLNEKMIVF